MGLGLARRRGKRGDETVAGWAARWLELRSRQKESTNIAYREQVAPFERAHGAMSLRDVNMELALEWTIEHRWTIGGIRAMFSDSTATRPSAWRASASSGRPQASSPPLSRFQTQSGGSRDDGAHTRTAVAGWYRA
jgi:hypothetical protein